MKNKILITVAYLVEKEQYAFWEKETGEVQKEILDALDERFPAEITLSENIQAKKINLSHRRIDYPNSNVLTCPICKCLITDTTKPNLIQTLNRAKELEGVLMCSSCAWELGYDIQCGRSIESIIEKYKGS